MTTITTYSNSTASVVESAFDIGDTVYIEGDITASAASTGTTASIKIYNSSGTLKATPLNTTHNFTNNTSQSIKTDINSGTAPSWNSSGQVAGEYYLTLSLSGSGVESTTLRSYFQLATATVSPPVISGAALGTASITDVSSTDLTCSITNMSASYDAFVLIGSDEWKMSTSNNADYSLTLYGRNIGLTASAQVEIYSSNGGGTDTDTSLDITVTAGTTEAVVLIETLLDTNWTTANVAKPTITIGGTARSPFKETSTTDFIKIYRSPIPSKYSPRFRMDYEDGEEFVQIMLITSNASPRDRMDDLWTEVNRILKSVAANPGGGWQKLWPDTTEMRKEFSNEFKQVMDVKLTKIVTAVNT